MHHEIRSRYPLTSSTYKDVGGSLALWYGMEILLNAVNGRVPNYRSKDSWFESGLSPSLIVLSDDTTQLLCPICELNDRDEII